MCGRITHCFPCVLEPVRIEIADNRLALAFRRRPPDPLRRAIRKPPPQQKLKARRLPRGDGPLKAKHSDGIVNVWRRSQVACPRKLVPKMKWRVPPSPRRPTF